VLDPFDRYLDVLLATVDWLDFECPLHDKIFLLKHKSHDLFFSPRVVEAILQLPTIIIQFFFFLHANEHANQQVSLDQKGIQTLQIHFLNQEDSPL